MRVGFFLGVTFFLLVFFASDVRSEDSERKGVPPMLKGNLSALKADPGGRVVDPMEEIPQAPRFPYNSLGRRDPFLSFVQPADHVSKNLPPLQQVALSQLKVIGVAWGGGEYSAMVQTPGGKSYPVKRGTKIGTNQGRVKGIGAKEVIVEEPYLNIFGRTDLKEVVMKLYSKKEGVE